MKASKSIKDYLDQIKSNVQHQIGEDDKEIIYTDLDFIAWLIDELGGDLTKDIDINDMYNIYIDNL